MEDLQRKHRQEQKDLQSRITQKKKSATKKTRKGVNDECAALEARLKEKQSLELSSLASDSPSNGADDEQAPIPNGLSESDVVERSNTLEGSVNAMSISDGKGPSENAKKPNRQKARLARRAAEQEAAAEQAAKEAEDLPNLRATESEAMQKEFKARGLKERQIRSDGHCMYAAFADQLSDQGMGLKPSVSIE